MSSKGGICLTIGNNTKCDSMRMDRTAVKPVKLNNNNLVIVFRQ